MRQWNLCASVMLAGILSASCGGGSSSPAAPATPTTTTTPTVVAASWTAEGVRLTDITSGFPGTVLANPSVFKLNDGRFRMLMTGGGSTTGIISAVSSDGLTWTMESGRRVQNSGDCGHVRGFRLDDGRLRVYCRNPSGILAYISSDEGITLTPETGLMITNAQAGSTRLSTGGIVRTKDNRWRMYFSDETSGAPPGAMKIFSAVSTDLLTWSVEPGIRIGSGATASGSATHPSAILNADGSVSVAYTRFSYPGASDSTISAVWIATSGDGLTFTKDESTKLTPGADADIVSMNGTIRVYYNWGDDTHGTIYSGVLSGALTPLTFGFLR
jgi:hypothetical protein